MSRTTLPLLGRRPGSIQIEDLAAAFCLFAIWLSMAYSPFRLITYVIPVVVLLVILANRRFTMPPNGAPYFVLVVIGLALAAIGHIKGWQDIWLMLIGLAPFCFGHAYRVTWKQAFVATFTATVILLVLLKGLGSVQGVEFDATKSRSPLESPTSFVFAVLAVWAALEKRWWRTVLCLVIAFLTLKRIAVIAAVLTVCAMLLPRRLMDRLLTPLPMILLNAAYLLIVVFYTQGDLNRWLYDLTGQSANQFGMGRQALYRFPVEALLADTWRYMFYGDGPGAVYELMKGGWTYLSSRSNLHNDSLKILIEYGGIAWVCFFAAMYWPSVAFDVRAFLFFTNVVLLTDNALIYPFAVFSVALACSRVVADRREAARSLGAGKPLATEPEPSRRAALRGLRLPPKASSLPREP